MHSASSRFLLARGSPAVLERVCVFAFREDHGDWCIHCHIRSAFGHQDFAERALVDGFHLHGGLIRLDLGDHVARFDRVALFLQPLGQVPLLHGGGQGGHQDLCRHGGGERPFTTWGYL